MVIIAKNGGQVNGGQVHSFTPGRGQCVDCSVGLIHKSKLAKQRAAHKLRSPVFGHARDECEMDPVTMLGPIAIQCFINHPVRVN